MANPPLLLLHGALGDASGFSELQKKLQYEFDVHVLNFTGHGGREIPAGPFTMQFFSDDIVSYLELHNLHNANIFGYSMGGYAAVWMARHYPGRAAKIMTLATKWDWNETAANKEAAMLNPEKMEEKIPAYTRVLEKRHAPESWKEVVRKTSEMMLRLSKHPLAAADFGEIGIPVRVCIGDRDTMVSMEESLAVYRQLKNGSFEVLPMTPHPFEKVNLYSLGYSIARFFLN